MDDTALLDLITTGITAEADDEEIVTFVVAALGLRMPKATTV